MLRYLIYRLILTLPTLLVFSFLAFGLRECTPDDPVTHFLPAEAASLGGPGQDHLAYEKSYRQTSHQLGLDLPTFYLSFSNAAYPDTLHRIVRKDQRTSSTRPGPPLWLLAAGPSLLPGPEAPGH
ncbi:MAG: hypothetical protein HC821_00695 [Lewinella sp.]|nr:hypothetical protein [Lewinella sp.]